MSFIRDPETGETRFDFRTHIMDPKTGKVIKHQPYKKVVRRDGNPTEYYERDGIRYFESGEFVDKSDKEIYEKRVAAEKAKKQAAKNPEAPPATGDAVDL